MARPYKVKHYKIVGVLAVLMSGFMVAMYIIPGSGQTLYHRNGQWLVDGLFLELSSSLYVIKYKKIGSHIDVAVDEEETVEEDHTFEEALGAVNATENVVEVQPAINLTTSFQSILHLEAVKS